MVNPQPIGPRSAAVLGYLARLPRFVLVLGVLALVLAGLFAPGLIGALLLVLVATLAGWLAWITWSGQPAGTRLLRVLVIAALLVMAASKLG